MATVCHARSMPTGSRSTPSSWSAPEPVSAAAPALTGPVLMNQDWLDLTFLHWAVDPGRVAHLMPRGVRPDVHEATGSTYVGLVPFRMRHAAPFRLPGVPWLGTFLETNVRLYSVDRYGVRGVVFLSLDCERVVVTAGARAALRHAVPVGADAAPHEPGRARTDRPHLHGTAATAVAAAPEPDHRPGR